MSGLISQYLPISHGLVTSSSTSMSSLTSIDASPASDGLLSPVAPPSISDCSGPDYPEQYFGHHSDQEEHRAPLNYTGGSTTTIITTTTAPPSRRRRFDELASPPSTPSSNGSSNDGFCDAESVSGYGVYLGSSSGEESSIASKAVSQVSRLQRNQAEKQRRDKLNICIGKLAAMVPFISMSTKRINKSGILRLTASYLRLHQRLLNGLKMQSSWRPLFSGSDELGGMLLESVEGFMVIIDKSGRILFVSDGVEKFLGHAVVDVLGQPLRALVHPDDHQLLDNSLGALFANNSDCVTETNAPRCSFFCSLAWNVENRAGPGSNYELFNVTGHLKCVPTVRVIPGDDAGSRPDVEKVFVGLAKRCSKLPWQRVFNTVGHNEMVFRSCLNSRVTFVDQSLCSIMGMMPSELIGSSGYGIIMQEDFPLAAMAHSQLIQDGYFHRLPIRLYSRFAKVIYVVASGRMVNSLANGENDTLFVHCSVLPVEEGEKALEVAHSRITPYVAKSDMRLVAEMILKGNGNDVAVCTRIKEKLFPAPEQQPVKRPRGRPRKYPVATLNTVAATNATAPDPATNGTVDPVNGTVDPVNGTTSSSQRRTSAETIGAGLMEDMCTENCNDVLGDHDFYFGNPVANEGRPSNPLANPFLDYSTLVLSGEAGDFVTSQSLTDI